jgi:hypothetical protein
MVAMVAMGQNRTISFLYPFLCMGLMGNTKYDSTNNNRPRRKTKSSEPRGKSKSTKKHARTKANDVRLAGRGYTDPK